MDIFESLENLNVSEECFDEIMGIVEEIIKRHEPIPDNKPCAMSWNNNDGTYKVVTFKDKHGRLSDPETNKHLDGKTFKSSKAADNYASKKGYVVHSVEESIKDITGYCPKSIQREVAREFNRPVNQEKIEANKKNIYDLNNPNSYERKIKILLAKERKNKNK